MFGHNTKTQKVLFVKPLPQKRQRSQLIKLKIKRFRLLRSTFSVVRRFRKKNWVHQSPKKYCVTVQIFQTFAYLIFEVVYTPNV